MNNELRKTGIDVLGDVPWGTHFCQFYDTAQDLIDILVPYFKAGLESGEHCMWVTAEPLTERDAEAALRAAVPNLDEYIRKRQIEIIPHTEWYLRDGKFDQERVLNGWVQRLQAAEQWGFTGLRLTGNTFWLEKPDWAGFTDYEEAINRVIGDYRMIAICTYASEKCGVAEIADVLSNHEFALIKRGGKWAIIQSAENEQTKQELQAAREQMERQAEDLEAANEELMAMNEELETTNEELRVSNDELQTEVREREKTQVALRESEQRVRLKLESILSPEGDIGTLELADIIDAPAIQQLMDSFYELARIPMAIIDLKGKTLVGAGWQDICTHFHRAHPDTCKFCIESDTLLTLGVERGETKLYKCKNNMWDIATPIMVGGQHVGNLFSGQFFFEDEPLDYEYFRLQAKRYGFDEKEYIAALERAPRLSRERLDEGMAFFVKLADMLSQLSYSNIKLARALAERDRLTESLRESQEDLNRAQEVSHTGSWSLNVRKNELLWSDENHRIFGIPRGIPLRYETFLGTIHPDDREYVDAKWMAALRGEPYDIEHRIVANGEVKWAREKAYLEFDEDGKLLGGFGITQDITEKKEAEEELRQSAERLSRSQEIAHLGSWELDLVKNELTWSDEVYRIFGLQPQEFGATYEAFLEAVHPEDRAAVDAAYSGSVRDGLDSYEIEHRIVRKATGEVRWVHERCYHARNEAGEIIRSVGMVLDITERKQAEFSQRLAADALRILNRGTDDLRSLIVELLRLIKGSTGYDAVGLRIGRGDDYPYYEQSGFSDEFVEKENSLCESREDGSTTLECTCGLVISGQTDPSLPIFTDGGSFWTNKSSDLLELPAEEDPRTNPRNRCITAGYQSVALIPVRSGEEIIGLLQLNDRQEGAFTPELIGFFEGLADNIGLALKRKQAEEALREAQEHAEQHAAEIESLVASMGDGVALFDTNYEISLLNDAARGILGTPAHVSTQEWSKNYKIRSIDDAPIPVEEYPSRRAMRGEAVADLRCKYVTPWAESLVSVTATPVRDAEGRIAGAVLVYRDVAEQIEWERKREEVYDREHHIAEVLQEALIPQTEYEVPGWGVAVRYVPALEEARVGGDFYDVFDLGDNKIGILMGDVAGKGLQAAMRVSGVRHAVRSYAYLEPDPAMVMTLVNQSVIRDHPEGDSLMTAFFAVLDLEKATLHYTNSGHEPPLLLTSDGEVGEFRCCDPALGFFDGAAYTATRVRLEMGDAVLMITDGVTEARSPAGQLFGKDGVIEWLQEHPKATLDEIADGILAAARSFGGGALRDDAAVLILCDETDILQRE